MKTLFKLFIGICVVVGIYYGAKESNIIPTDISTKIEVEVSETFSPAKQKALELWNEITNIFESTEETSSE